MHEFALARVEQQIVMLGPFINQVKVSLNVCIFGQ